MRADVHLFYRNRTDDLLLTGTDTSLDQALSEHLQACPQCREYSDTNMRALTALSSFAFDFDSSSEVRLFHELQRRDR